MLLSSFQAGVAGAFYLVLTLVLQVHELKMEKKKADALTYQMLPPTVARVANLEHEKM